MASRLLFYDLNLRRGRRLIVEALRVRVLRNDGVLSRRKISR